MTPPLEPAMAALINVVINADVERIERKLDLLMADIDVIQADFDRLDQNTRDLLDTVIAARDALQTEIDQLRSDDAVEDTKLDGLGAAITDLDGAVQAFQAAQPDTSGGTPGQPDTSGGAPDQPPADSTGEQPQA